MKRASSQIKSDYLEATVNCLERNTKETDYVVTSLKTEIRLLRDTLAIIKNTSINALDTDDLMFETLNGNIETGNHQKHRGETIFYPGEEKILLLIVK